jgi:choline dehydrogenase-like flavoprotein
MIIDTRTLDSDLHERVDVVIVGSGAGGAPMAYELSAAGLRVALVEEGRRYEVDQFNRDTWAATKEMYRDASMSATLGTPPVPLPLGITLGGTTTVNSGTCFRTPPKLFAEWKKKYGLGDLTYEQLTAHFEAVEETIHVQDVPFELMGANNQIFAEGAKRLGLHGAPLKRNFQGCRGAGLCAFGCPNSAKRSMSLNYIPAAEANGALIYTSARVKDIHIHKGRASGVSGVFVDDQRRARGKFRIDAPVVVLSCGTIYTPLLLLQNGLANSSGHVGRNLRVHPAAKVIAVFDRVIDAWSGVPQAYYVDEYADEGIMFEGFYVPPAFLGFALPAFGARLKDYMADYSKLAGFGVMVSDTSHGRVHRAPGGKPLVTYNLNQFDTDRFVKGVEIACRVYFEMGAQKLLPPIFGIEEFNSPDDLAVLKSRKVRPADLEIIAFHPMGTCRMGDDPKDSVINANMETHDVAGLFIADGSVFPSSLGVNPQESIMAFSRHAAHYIIANREVYVPRPVPV